MGIIPEVRNTIREKKRIYKIWNNTWYICGSNGYNFQCKKHLETQHGSNRTKTDLLFKVLRKCNSKFDCLVYEMLYIKDIKPSLNTQAHSIRAKLFTWHFRTFCILFCIFICFFLLCFLPSELYQLDPQIFYVLFQILYIRFTAYTFSLFNLIMA